MRVGRARVVRVGPLLRRRLLLRLRVAGGELIIFCLEVLDLALFFRCARIVQLHSPCQSVLERLQIFTLSLQFFATLGLQLSPFVEAHLLPLLLLSIIG